VKQVANIFLAIVGLAVLAVLGFVLLFERIPPATIGVKQSQWGGGIIEQDYSAGFRWGVTGYHKWYLLDGRTHFLTFSERLRRVSSNERPGLEIRTRDNNSIDVDVTLTYRIKPGAGHLIVDDGLQAGYRDRVTSTVESVLRKELAKLTSEEFVATEIRMERARKTLPVLATNLEDFHVEPLELLIRAVRFQPEYEQKKQDQQLVNQNTLLATAEERVERQEQVTGVIGKETEALEKERRATWDKLLQDARSENEIAVARILAEAEVYEKTTRSNADADYVSSIAAGELALAKAEALRNELRNKALDTTGGSILLAMQAADNLIIDEVTLNSNDPEVPSVLDIGEMVRLLVGPRR